MSEPSASNKISLIRTCVASDAGVVDVVAGGVDVAVDVAVGVVVSVVDVVDVCPPDGTLGATPPPKTSGVVGVGSGGGVVVPARTIVCCGFVKLVEVACPELVERVMVLAPDVAVLVGACVVVAVGAMEDIFGDSWAIFEICGVIVFGVIRLPADGVFGCGPASAITVCDGLFINNPKIYDTTFFVALATWP